MTAALVFAGLCPHLLSASGQRQPSEIGRTLDGVRSIAARLIALEPEVAIVVLPKLTGGADAFPLYSGPRLSGEPGSAGLALPGIDVANDPMLLSRVVRLARESGLPVEVHHAGRPLNPGAFLPIHALLVAGHRGRIMLTGAAALPAETHLQYGGLLARAAGELGMSIALLACGVLAGGAGLGRNTDDGAEPRSYNRTFVRCVAAGDAAGFLALTGEARERAGSNAGDPVRIALGAMGGAFSNPEICSYEAHPDVEYVSAVLHQPTAPAP
ncbi:MAG: hypothetical protein HY650_14190 [Acidobacteria bacterium]|nr:hypothetical protein [Acidobacteriota bacterium]